MKEGDVLFLLNVVLILRSVAILNEIGMSENNMKASRSGVQFQSSDGLHGEGEGEVEPYSRYPAAQSSRPADLM